MGDETQAVKKGRTIPVVLLLLLLTLIAYSIYSGSIIKRLGVPGFEVEFAERSKGGIVSENKVAQVGEEELRKRQASLEEKLKGLEAQLENKSDSSGTFVTDVQSKTTDTKAEQSGAPTFDLSGKWTPQAGDVSSYTIQHNGDSIVLEQSVPLYGVLAVGQGQIVGRNVNITYTTVLGTTGKGNATISPDGKRIIGQVTDLNTGVTSPLIISR